MSDDRPDHITIDRETAILAREAIINLVINDWSALDCSKLKAGEHTISQELGRDPEFTRDDWEDDDD